MTLISNLGLSRKAYDALKSCGARTVEDILLLSKHKVMMQKSVGPLTVRKIEFALRRLGYEWTDKTVDEPPITLRDKFAMAALVVANGDAEKAYEIADNMIAERRK